MSQLEYQHIGHDPRHGDIALWSMDDAGRLHESRKRFEEPNREWLDWSHEQVFREIKPRAVGRVELNRRTGSIYISDPALGLRPTHLIRLLDALDRRYPHIRWYVFGSGYKGESAAAAVAAIAAG